MKNLETADSLKLVAVPLVSIVVPTYNRAHLVSEALDAILAQTYENLQVIIVNDGSIDTTRELLATYAAKDSRVEVINKENEGIPDTVNRGWRAATGEYVTWTSDDNIYYLSAIEEMVAHLEQHPDVAMVYTDCRFIDACGNELYTRASKEPESLEDECPISGCLLFRRSVFEEVEMFQKRWRRVHDYDFYRRVWKKYKVARIPEVLYDYRLHAASMTGDHYAMTTEHAELLDSVLENRAARRAAWGRCWHEIARQAEREGLRWKAVFYYLRAAISEPRRTGAFWSSLWKTGYSVLPQWTKNCWRSIKARNS